MLTAGIDAGMRLVKICVIENKKILATRSFEMDAAFKTRCSDALAGCIDEISASVAASGRLKTIVATGYGAPLVKHASLRPEENACIAAAARETSSAARTVVDAGGLFIKIHKIDENGQATGTVANEKCAAGSGRFLEITAEALKLPFPTVAAMDLSSAEPFHITSSCAVFAESEVISQIGRGTPGTDILAGVLHSLAAKTVTLMDHARAADPVVLTGGLSSVAAYVDMLRKLSGRDMAILHPGPGIVTAYGAALIGEAVRPGLAGRVTARFMPGRIRHG